MSKYRALKGTIVHTPQIDKMECFENSYLIYKDNEVMGIYAELPENMKDIEVKDYTGKIIMPGMSDIHIHAPQYVFHGIGQNIESQNGAVGLKHIAFRLKASLKI